MINLLRMSKEYLNHFLCGKAKCYYINKINKIKCNKKRCKVYGSLDIIHTEPENYYTEENGNIFLFEKGSDGYKYCKFYLNKTKEILNQLMKY